MFFTRNSLAVALFFMGAMQAHMARAQEALRPLSSSDTVQAETSRTPKTTWLGKVEGWDKYEPRTFAVARGDGTVQTLLASFRGQVSKLRFDAASFSTIPYVQEKAPEILADTTTRQAGALASGMKWTSRITFVGSPADWCPNDFKSTFDGTFEVEPQESYSLRIDGKDVTVPVLPVVERGTWNRCYTGKRYQRFLWSPDLATVVSIEFLTYTPTGQLHENTYAMRVKEVQRGGQQ